MINKEGSIRTRRELANYYNINEKTLAKWLKRENISLPKGLINPKWVKKVIEKFGKPIEN
jgi:hypothetical protein